MAAMVNEYTEETSATESEEPVVTILSNSDDGAENKIQLEQEEIMEANNEAADDNNKTKSNRVVSDADTTVPINDTTTTPKSSSVESDKIDNSEAAVVANNNTSGAVARTVDETRVELDNCLEQWDIRLEDVKGRVVTKPDPRGPKITYVIDEIRGVQVANIKYNDLRKICVRLRIPGYKHQNKDGMIELIARCKLALETGRPIIPDKPLRGVPPSVLYGPVAHHHHAMMSQTGVHNNANNNKRIRTDEDDNSRNKRSNDVVGSAAISGYHPPHSSMRPWHDLMIPHNNSNNNSNHQPPPLNINGGYPQHRAHGQIGNTAGNDELPPATAVAIELSRAKLSVVHFEKFCDVSDRIRTLRREKEEEKLEENKIEIVAELERLLEMKAELSQII